MQVDHHVGAAQGVGVGSDQHRRFAGQRVGVATVRHETRRGRRPQQAVDGVGHRGVRRVNHHLPALAVGLGGDATGDVERGVGMGVEEIFGHFAIVNVEVNLFM